MRVLILTFLVLTLSGCTAMLLGGGGSDGRAERGVRTTAQMAIDGRITTDVRNALVDDPVLGRYNLSVQTFDNRVTLRGSVGGFRVRERAVALADAVDGVESVDNRIRVDTGN